MERKLGGPCVLYDRECIGCLECDTCDLDPNKVCDNCGKCAEVCPRHIIWSSDIHPAKVDISEVVEEKTEE